MSRRVACVVWQKRCVAVGIAMIALLVGAIPAAAAQPRADLTTCFWGGVAGAPPAKNRLVTDLNELAFFGVAVLPRGGSLHFTHVFPHARSVAWSTYDPFTFTPLDTLRDDELVADQGSVNPFTPGASRQAPNRAYTLTVTTARRPDTGAPPNTLYTNGKTVVAVFYRLYVPDQGRDRLGDAGLPDLRYRPFRWGPTLTNDRACMALNGGRTATGPLYDLVWNSTTVGLGPSYHALLALRPESDTFPARAEGRWDVFFGILQLARPFLREAGLNSQATSLPAAPTGPAVDWDSDSAVAVNYVDRRLGPDPDGRNLLVVRGVMPRTPRTFGGDPVMGEDADMRYWSLCTMNAPPLGRTGSCLFDEQVPVDASRHYTIVVGAPQDRPPNATESCGVAWLDWSPDGDGYGRETAGTLTLRNQDPAPGFTRAIQNVTAAETEREVMGAYLPTQTYVSAEAFAARGCAGAPAS